MLLDFLLHLSPIPACWRVAPNQIQLGLAALLLMAAAIGPRLMVGNRGWVRALITLAGLGVLVMAFLNWGTRCDSTLKILQRAVALAAPAPAHPSQPAPGSERAGVNVDAKAAAPIKQPPDTGVSGATAQAVLPNFFAGPAFLTYDRLLRELLARARQARDRIEFGIRNSLGSVDTMWVINGPANAAWGLVQGDVKLFLQWLDLSDLELLGLKPDAATRRHLQNTVGQMVVVQAMHLETVHVISNRPQLRNFADLKAHGSLVLVPNDSQGSTVSALNLMRLHGVPTERLQANAGALEQLAKVIDGQADAVVITAGVPAKLISAIGAVPAERRRHLHLIEVDPQRLGGVYELRQVHYPQWQPQPEMAPVVRALWVGWDFSAKPSAAFKLKCQQTVQLKRVLHEHLAELQADPEAHAAWRTVDLGVPVIGWPANKCVSTQAPVAN